MHDYKVTVTMVYSNLVNKYIVMLRVRTLHNTQAYKRCIFIERFQENEKNSLLSM